MSSVVPAVPTVRDAVIDLDLAGLAQVVNAAAAMAAEAGEAGEAGPLSDPADPVYAARLGCVALALARLYVLGQLDAVVARRRGLGRGPDLAALAAVLTEAGALNTSGALGQDLVAAGQLLAGVYAITDSGRFQAFGAVR
jgi:hypothetical protein